METVLLARLAFLNQLEIIVLREKRVATEIGVY
jgi:hypothetical protein